MLLYIKTLSGRTIEIEAEVDDTIGKIKHIITTKQMIPFDQQNLVSAGKCLQNDNTLRHYNIKNGNRLYLYAGTRGMSNVEESKDHIKFMNKNNKKSITIYSYHISNKSDKFEKGSAMIGIILYQYNNKSEWELNGIHCKSGYIYLCKTDNLTDIDSFPINTKHAKCYKKLFDQDPDYTKLVAAGCGYLKDVKVDNQWKWKYMSGTFNAPTHCNKRNVKIAKTFPNYEFKDEWHDNDRKMHKIEEKWLNKTIEQWIESKFTKSTLYVSYVTWSWWNGEWSDYDQDTNKYIENEYGKFIDDYKGNVEITYSINLNVGNFANDKCLSGRYKIYFSAPNISLNAKKINSRNHPKWKNDSDERNNYFLQENYVKSKFRIVRRRNMNEIQSNVWYESCVCL
eukprot:473808_1